MSSITSVSFPCQTSSAGVGRQEFVRRSIVSLSFYFIFFKSVNCCPRVVSREYYKGNHSNKRSVLAVIMASEWSHCIAEKMSVNLNVNVSVKVRKNKQTWSPLKVRWTRVLYDRPPVVSCPCIVFGSARWGDLPGTPVCPFTNDKTQHLTGLYMYHWQECLFIS